MICVTREEILPLASIGRKYQALWQPHMLDPVSIVSVLLLYCTILYLLKIFAPRDSVLRDS